MASDPLGLHDWHSADYVNQWIESDSLRDEQRNLILQRVAQLIPYDPQARIRVLDVGAGYGALTQQVAALFPNAELVMQDFSEAMFSRAREGLGSEEHRIRYVLSDLQDPAWTQALPGPFEAVVSSIAIHNVRSPARIRGIYREIFPLVKPGGCFLNCDHMAPGGERVAQAQRRPRLLERQRLVKEETGEEVSLEVVEEERRGRRARAHDLGAPGGHLHQEAEDGESATLENQLRWLREAGFDEVDCFWKEGQQAIIGGYRRDSGLSTSSQ